jgi:hypothetical protein
MIRFERFIISFRHPFYGSLFRGKKFYIRLTHSYSVDKSSTSSDLRNFAVVPNKSNTINLFLNTSNLKEEWSEEELRLKEEAERENSWVPVFRNRGLFKFFVVLRFNTLLFFGSYILLLYSIVEQLLATGLVDLLIIAPQLGLTIFATVINFLIKRYFTRVVGVISVDKKSRTIYRIGHFSGVGNRQNKFARLGDIKDLIDSNPSGVGSYAKLSWTFRSKDFLLIPTIGCEIIDERAAYLLLGSLENFHQDSLPETKTLQELEASTDEKHIKRLIEKPTDK